MNEAKARRIQKIYDYLRYACITLFLLFLASVAGHAQTVEERLSALEKAQTEKSTTSKYMPQLHGILRGKYEYEPDLDASRFEVRNARLSVSGNLPLRSEYKLEVDLCDETKMKMKDAWVRINPWKTFRLSLGQQRMPFSIDAHRNPSAQYFANRSFIAKQVGDMRDVGMILGYSFQNADKKNVVVIDAGMFNGSNLDNQKTAWHSDWNYSARLQWYPVKGLCIMPSIQHQAIASRKAHYTSLDFGSYYEVGGLHLEAEYLHKSYSNDAFNDCGSVDAMAIYKQKFNTDKGFLEGISYLARYDYMDDHTDGTSGFVKDADGNETSKLVTTDYARNRMTLGVTLHVRNKYFPTDLRFNYEKYWYKDGGTPKESEQDKLVAELAIKF